MFTAVMFLEFKNANKNVGSEGSLVQPLSFSVVGNELIRTNHTCSANAPEGTRALVLEEDKINDLEESKMAN